MRKNRRKLASTVKQERKKNSRHEDTYEKGEKTGKK